MSDTWGYNDGNDVTSQGNNTDNSGPKALRDAYEAMKAQNKELQDGLAAIQNELRAQKVSSVFDSLGIPGAAKLYAGDADPEKAREWAESMRSVFGGGNPGGTPQEAAQQSIDSATQDQLQRMNEAGSAGQPLTNLDAASQGIGQAGDVQALIDVMRRAQNMS